MISSHTQLAVYLADFLEFTETASGAHFKLNSRGEVRLGTEATDELTGR